MLITLVQNEIEQAIQDYVLARIRIQEGLDMQIDLAATRGIEGFKATINIEPSGLNQATKTMEGPSMDPPVEVGPQESAKQAPTKPEDPPLVVPYEEEKVATDDAPVKSLFGRRGRTPMEQIGKEEAEALGSALAIMNASGAGNGRQLFGHLRTQNGAEKAEASEE